MNNIDKVVDETLFRGGSYDEEDIKILREELEFMKDNKVVSTIFECFETKEDKKENHSWKKKKFYE